MIALLALPWVRQAAMAGAVLAAVLGGLVWLRRDAARDALKDFAAIQAAATRENRKASDEERARVDAGRDGAADSELRRDWQRDN